MKLYKFRSLGDGRSFCHAREILDTGKFWCSRFWDLNDPMEGVYYAHPEIIPVIFNEKANRVICSFSDVHALSSLLMWGYYANGFKGMAIEIEVPKDKLQRVNYEKDVHMLAIDAGPSPHAADHAIRILTTKLKQWKHEYEFRFLDEGKRGAKKIGEITKVYFGDPYGDTAKPERLMEALRAYHAFRKELKALAQCKGIACDFVTVSGNTVVPATTH